MENNRKVMKLMVVGSDKIYAIENFYIRHLRGLGIEVDHFLAQTMFYDYYQKGIVNKILYKTGMSGIISKINALFIERVKQSKPDLVWVFKGMELTPSSLEQVRKMGIRLVNYNPDNPFIFTGKGSGNKYITDSIGLYDFHFTYNLEIQRNLRERYGASTAFLPFGYDIEEELYAECALQSEIVKACFLGNPDVQRTSFIKMLAISGVKIDVFGNNWNKYIHHKNVRIFDPVYGKALWKTLRKYRVQLNLMRIHSEDSHNMRSFEVPGIGGIMLAPDTSEHRIFFKDRDEVFLFDSLESCVESIQLLLNLPESEAGLIRESARRRSITSGYSYKDRAAFAMDVLRERYG